MKSAVGLQQTQCFILELPLSISPQEETALAARFEAARQLYNAVLGEALRRMFLMKESKEWKKARTLPLKTRERSRSFAECSRRFGFTDYDLQAYGTRCKKSCWIGEHLDAHAAQTTATRAFRAAERYLFRSSGKPRFKTKRQGLSSVEGKSNATGIRWRTDRVEWSGLILAPRFDRKDKHGVQSLALQCPVKYVRLVRRSVMGRIRWFVQIVCSGTPKWKEKNPVGEGTVGLDLGPSTVAVVGDRNASLEGFCPGLPDFEKTARRLKRAMDRSRRLSNPGNFNPDGTVKPGRREWVFTRGYLRLRAKVSDLERRKAAYRKTEHGKLVHRVIEDGTTIKTEKLSYKAFQKNFGKSVGNRAPGLFMNLLRRKAESAGGRVLEFSTRTTRLSQVCHECGTILKKRLSLRWHRCPCGIGPVQRDLYSAYLARHVENGILSTESAREGWRAAESLLREAVERVKQTASGKVRPASFGF